MLLWYECFLFHCNISPLSLSLLSVVFGAFISSSKQSVVLDLIVKHGLHRLAVVDHEGNLATIITQSHVVNLIGDNFDKAFKSLASQKISESKVTFVMRVVVMAKLLTMFVKLGYRDVVSVRDTDIAYDAFQRIYDKVTNLEKRDYLTPFDSMSAGWRSLMPTENWSATSAHQICNILVTMDR